MNASSLAALAARINALEAENEALNDRLNSSFVVSMGVLCFFLQVKLPCYTCDCAQKNAPHTHNPIFLH